MHFSSFICKSNGETSAITPNDHWKVWQDASNPVVDCLLVAWLCVEQWRPNDTVVVLMILPGQSVVCSVFTQPTWYKEKEQVCTMENQ